MKIPAAARATLPVPASPSQTTTYSSADPITEAANAATNSFCN
jgi:hypothetical protein